MDYGGAIIGIALVFVSTALCYRFADVIFRRIGHAGTNVITRLSAFILLAIGVEIVWGGLKPLILALSAK
jgi:multiple antibiotic resistance protein